MKLKSNYFMLNLNNILHKSIITFTSILFFNYCFSQNQFDTLQKQILKETFSNYELNGISKRKMLDFNSGKYNPLTYLAGSLLFVYQNLISEQISANCMYQISCSEFTKRNIEKYGLIKGTLIGIHQLSCCQANIDEDFCQFRINKNGKIINPIE